MRSLGNVSSLSPMLFLFNLSKAELLPLLLSTFEDDDVLLVNFTNSTLRLLAFPSAVLLLSIGLLSPNPVDFSLLAAIPIVISCCITAFPRAFERLMLLASSPSASVCPSTLKLRSACFCISLYILFIAPILSGFMLALPVSNRIPFTIIFPSCNRRS